MGRGEEARVRDSNPPFFLILALKAQSQEYIAQGGEALGDEDGGFE